MGYHDRHPAASVEDPLLVIIGFAVAGAVLAAGIATIDLPALTSLRQSKILPRFGHPGLIRRKTLSATAKELRFARCCYDHLAGQIGVAITQALRERGLIIPLPDKRFDVSPLGVEWFRNIGLDVAGLKPTRRGPARQCLDWTERTHHLAGPLGVQFMSVLCARGWLRRSAGSRAVRITPRGGMELKRHLNLDEQRLRAQS